MLKLFIFICVISQLHKSIAGPIWNKYQHYLELHSVDIFREYLRIDTSQPENIKDAVEFWIRQMTELGIPYAIYEPAGKPVFVATVVGSNPSLPSIMLNSHMDVVKADPSEWKYPPFDAYMDVHGDIYARGTQDTKDVAIQYLEAIRNLKKNNITLLRTLHLTLMPADSLLYPVEQFISNNCPLYSTSYTTKRVYISCTSPSPPSSFTHIILAASSVLYRISRQDEEMGGKDGMKAFSKSKEFKSLNIGFALDEGLSSLDDSLFATFVDRRPWQMEFVIHGDGGHGFKMPDNSAMAKAHRFINAVMEYRDTQKAIFETKNSTDFTGYTSLNINVMDGGLAINIIPTQLKLGVDMRLSTDADVAEMDSIVQSWIHATGNTTDLTFFRKETDSGITSVDDTNPYWVTMRNTLNKLGIKITPVVCPATSDMLVIRNLGIPALGFSTKARTASRLHGKDEYQHVETFLKGIDIYTELIKDLGNLPCQL